MCVALWSLGLSLHRGIGILLGGVIVTTIIIDVIIIITIISETESHCIGLGGLELAV